MPLDQLTDAWFDREIAGCCLADERLNKRLRKLVAQIGGAMGQSIPLVCQDWANTKAAYRFFSNDRVSEADILAGHFESTRDRTVATRGPVLVLHDTTEFSYQRESVDAIGITKSINSGRDKAGRVRAHTVCGILMHSSLAVTTQGLPLGLAAIKFWTRKKFKGTAALKKKINPTRVPIEKKESIRWLENVQQSTALLGEPGRCVQVADREGDIYELFCAAQEARTHFLIRTCVDRLAADGDHTIANEMEEVAVKGLHRINVRDNNGDPDEAILEIRHRKIRDLPPIGEQKRYPALTGPVVARRQASRSYAEPSRHRRIVAYGGNGRAVGIQGAGLSTDQRHQHRYGRSTRLLGHAKPIGIPGRAHRRVAASRLSRPGSFDP